MANFHGKSTQALSQTSHLSETNRRSSHFQNCEQVARYYSMQVSNMQTTSAASPPSYEESSSSYHSSPATSYLSEESEEPREHLTTNFERSEVTMNAVRHAESPPNSDNAVTEDEEAQTTSTPAQETSTVTPQPRKGRGGRSELRCKQCRRRFRDPEELRNCTHGGAPIRVACPFPGCGRILNRQADLSRHHKSVCTVLRANISETNVVTDPSETRTPLSMVFQNILSE